uniref:Uncharacterized protein n=1 Tax=Anopheles minimus TaxID=112268 RepID=A0A182WNY9_9DIPT
MVVALQEAAGTTDPDSSSDGTVETGGSEEQPQPQSSDTVVALQEAAGTTDPDSSSDGTVEAGGAEEQPYAGQDGAVEVDLDEHECSEFDSES